MEWNIWTLAAIFAVIALPSFEAQSDYGWGQWSDFTECSRSCGGGIQQTVRRCENGRCQGHSVYYKSCNTQECPEHSKDFRTAQCESYNSVRMEVQGITRRHSWRPYFAMLTTNPSAPCALICQNEYGHEKRLRDTVVDGTHCDNGKAFGICIKGICKPVGCDHRLGSFINEDKCLQCGGTGDGCRTVKGSTLRKRLNAGKRTVVATIPDGAMTLRIRLISISPSSLELMSEEGNRLRLTEATVSFGRHKIAAYLGTLFRFTAKQDTMEFFARGPINESMQLLVRYRGLSPLVEYEYSMKEDPREEFGKEAQEVDLRQGRYRWIHGSWTPCSTECGPGYQLRAIKCIDNQKGQQASPSLCPRELMPRRNQTCNPGQCETIIRQAYKWIPGHWGECNVECGLGEQVQLMHCIETGTSGKSVYADEELCTRYAGAKPKYERVCRGETENCVEWTTSEWTECSVTCGYGRQTREVLCQRKGSRAGGVRETLEDEQCDDLDMPLTERLCHRGACADGSNDLNRRRTRPTQAPTRPTTCRTSRYGCCRDGVTFARGRNEEGCPREETVADLCQERSVRGPCTNYTVKWYYDVNKKECLRFWFGGCEGNENRFDDKPSCISRCMNLKAKPSIDNCLTSSYGCCADGRTHAQGPDREGCPEKNLVGGCAGTRYGCCEDGQTSASGPEKFGCPEKTLVGGCAGTRYGCCLDGKTAAAGENRYGCPEKYAGGCARTQYGCCADKVTAARGENQLGCPENPVVRCDMTQHGCCDDQETAATGPDGEGCPESQKVGHISSCQNSRYGCCSDNMTPAQGLNNEGCPSFDSAYCGFDKDSGNCSEYALQWYFETKYGMCRQFWYGGCGGNQNRFGTKEDCQYKCVNVTGPARCRLPKVTGPCRASKTRYYFNAATGRCESFIYGGCKANSNNFLTKSLCEASCNGAVSEEAGGAESACANNPCQYGFECQDNSNGTYQCACNPDWGENCSRLPSYWCFSDDECASGFSCVHQKRCRDESCYVYSRCSVDSRRRACERARCPSNQDCVNDAAQREGYVCVDKVDYKRPQSVVLNCAVHEFGCCPDGRMPAQGPENEGCSQDCRTSDYGCCPDDRTPASGPNLGGCEIEGSADMPCEKSEFGCCDDGIRTATGPRGEGCQDTTDAETTRQPTSAGMVKCTAEVSRELCTKYEVKWRYDSKLMACERHWWGGCRDNGNVFETEDECEAECITGVITEPTEDPDFVNICDMPSVEGPCRARIPRYFYDPRERNCRMFNYGGCSGNENNFRTIEECQRECMADVRRPSTPAPTTESPRSTEAPAEATLMMSAPATVVEGEELRVTCITSGPLGLRLEWFFNGQPVTEENVEITFDRKRITGGIEATGQLIIAAAMQENSGTYYCRNSELQTKSTSVTVQMKSEVTSPPTTARPFEASMTMSGQSVVYEGSEMRITCRARGPTDVGLEWFINGQPAADKEDVEITTDIKSLSGGYEIIGELIIARAQLSNSGTYYCRSADRQLESMVVTVRKGTSITTRPTETTTTTAPTEKPDESESSINMMGDARVPIGSTLSITCRAMGPRRPSSIEWFINGRYVNPRASVASISTSRDPRSLNAIVGTFSITNVNETNDGTYYCRSRPYGDIGRMSVKITDDPVVTEPSVTSSTTTTTTPTTDVTGKGSPDEVCKMNWDGGNCYANIPRWFYDHQEGACTEMVYGGCNGNANNFETEQECNNFCTARDICFQPKKIGMCRAAIPRFYFDSATKECKNFLYGGCDGNVNNFATLGSCERKCAEYLDKTDVNIGDKDEEENVCELSPEKGSCRGYNIKWYYSSSRNRCARFVYTGCDGNGNRFDSEDECKGKCIQTDVIRPTWRPPPTRRPTTTTTTTTTTPAPTTTTSTTQSNVIPRQYSCNLPSDYGPCHDYKIKWYFNTDDRRCLRFYYGGCGGNDNRFESRAECEGICVRGRVPTTRQTTTTTTTTTERPYVYACTYSRYGCCNDGVTSAADVRRSNCPENQRGGSGEDATPVMVPLGTDAVLICPVRTGDITWYRDGFILRSDRRFEIYDNATLIVRRVAADMAGNYACRISNGNLIPQLKRFKLSVNEPLSIVPGPALASVKPGEDAFLHCQALGNPTPSVRWERDGRIYRSDSRHNVFANGTLIIKGTNFADVGDYVCSAENGVSPPVKRVITLSLRENIEADIETHQGIYMEGDTIRISCTGEGYPPPEITWEKEGKMMEGNNRITVSGGDLIVRSASIEDAGMYKCTASNGRATATDFTTVQIKLQTPQAKCEDTMRHTKCHLIVTGRLCGFRMFANKCCKSCRRAGYV